MPSVGSASLDLVVDRHQVGRSISGAVGSQGGLMGGLGRKLGGLFLGGLAAAGIGTFVKDALGEAREAAKIGRLTEQVIKSTGKAANVSSGQVGKLAEELSAMAGIDDEIIQGGANVLLTFTNIRNQVGKGNKIFDLATAAALDMSVALGTDLQGSIIQVGKSLNDPIKGVTALQRVGVSFTKEQKEQIKTLVETGRTLDAQKLILKELQTEFGGAAEAGADAGAKASVAWGNLKEQLGTAVLPLFERVGTWLTGTGVPAVGKFASAIADGFRDPDKTVNAKGWAGTFTNIGQSIRDFVDDTKGAVGDFLAGFRGEESPETIFGNLGTSIRRLVDFARDEALPALKGIAGFLRDDVAPVLGKVLDFLTKNLEAVLLAWGTFKAITVGSAIVTAVAGAYNGLAVALGLTAANGHAAAAGLGAANTAAAGSGAVMAGATIGGWAAIIGAGVGLGVVLHNLIETHFPGINRALEDFGGHVYDFGVAALDKFKGLWDSIKSKHISLDVEISQYEHLRSLKILVDNLTSKTHVVPVSVRAANAQGLYPNVGTAPPAPSNRQKLYPGANAAGGGMPAGSFSWVGERGKELAYTSGGTRILSHSDSMRAIRSAVASAAPTMAAGPLQPLVLQVVGPNGSIEEVSTGLEARRRARS